MSLSDKVTSVCYSHVFISWSKIFTLCDLSGMVEICFMSTFSFKFSVVWNIGRHLMHILGDCLGLVI